MIRSLFLPIVLLSILCGLRPLTARAEPQWIWISKSAQDGEKATFRHSFNVSGPVQLASLSVTCDNGATVRLNGTKVAEVPDWMQPAKVDVTKSLKPGENTLSIDARNTDGVAALVATLSIGMADAKKQVIETGADWQGAAAGSTDFKPVVVIAKYGAQPWGDVFATKPGAGRANAAIAAQPAALTVAKDFKVDLIYTVPKADQGSWVSMAVDPKGRLIVCDQYGYLYRVTVPPLGATEGAKIEPLAREISGAHGLLFALESLYVMVNETQTNEGGQKIATKREPGLWRMKYRADDDQFEKPELLRKIQGSGEHGPHGLVLGPDGKTIYFAAGNHTKLPDGMEKSRAVAWSEDHLTPRLWDANGHAKGILAPGGYIARTDADGKSIELFCLGFRNQYDIAFDTSGELFTFDSDMEWDFGTPWYMPTRINHCVDGGDYGWRSGAGRWPDYYADSLPAVVDIGPGSPTGTLFGTGGKFPAKYQRALFALDWTYATIWAVHLTPDGATFRGEKEEFIGGKAFSVSDAMISPQDGAMYVTVGGRGNQSALYRVTYAGPESTAPAPRLAVTPEAKLRHELETLHAEGTGPEAIAKAWPHLANADRFIRFAARVAIERQPASQWAERALAEKNPQASIEALIALARVGDQALQPRLIAALSAFDFAKLPSGLRLPLLRAWELAFTRMGKPSPEAGRQALAKLDPLFPHADPLVNRELVSLLVFLDSPSIVARTVPLLDTAKDDDVTIASEGVLARNDGYARAVAGLHESRPNRQAIAYAYALRVATAGWTPELRKAFFGWFPRTREWKGGNSFTKFLENIRNDALANGVTDPSERAALTELSKAVPPAPNANLVMPKGPGKAYAVDELVTLAKDGLRGRNFAHGKAMFASTLCINCHHFAGEGGNIGPDLTGSGSRYSMHDLAENIIEPSKIISDQYGTEQIEKKDGSTIIGRVVVEENGKLFVMTSALAPDEQTAVNAADVKSRQPFNVSMMPPGLINPLNKDELLDLLAYVLSAGNPQDKAFQP